MPPAPAFKVVLVHIDDAFDEVSSRTTSLLNLEASCCRQIGNAQKHVLCIHTLELYALIAQIS
jgi:hypothetical protein